MRASYEQELGRRIAAWVSLAARLRLAVLAVTVVCTGATASYVAGNLAIRGDTEYLLSPDLPYKESERRYRDSFPELYENLFVVIDAETPEQAGAAASALASRLEDRPAFFHGAFLPGGGEFFEQHAFLYLDTPELEALADDLASVQPYLAELSRDGTLRGLASMMARGVRAVNEGDVSAERLRPIFDVFGDSLEAQLVGRDHRVSWADVLAGSGLGGDGRRRFLVVQPVLDHTDLQPAKRAIHEVRRLARNLGLGPENGVTVRITGDVALSYEEMETVKGQAALAGAASFVLVGTVLGFGLRSFRLVAAILVTLAVGLVLTAGFTALAIGHLNMISAAFAVLFIGLGVDFGIHLCVRYRESILAGSSHGDALEASARDVGGSLVLCAATTAIGFLAFVPTAFVGVAELGLISGAGMFISLGCTLTVLPALLSLAPLEGGVVAAAPRTRWAGSWMALPLRHPRVIRWSALALGLVAVLALPQARFDNNPLNVRDPASESVQTFNDLLERVGVSPWSLNAVAADLTEAAALAEELQALDVVGEVVSVSDFVPADQDAKLDIIADVAMFLAPSPGPDGRAPPPTLAEQVTALRELGAHARSLSQLDASEPLRASAARLEPVLDEYLAQIESSPTASDRIEALEASVLGTLPEQLRVLTAALGAGRVTLENLPKALVERMVARDGRVRLEIFPAEDLNDHAAMAAFVDGVREVRADVAGSAAEMVEAGRTVVTALRQAMLAAVVLMTLFLLALWRRFDDTALVLIPLVLAATLLVAAAVWLDIPFNFADVIVLPLLLGIGVDSGIHLVHRARLTHAGGSRPNLLATSTARAVALSAATTIASFGTMGFATHRGLATLGQLLTLGVGLALLCNLIVLPALIQLKRSRPRLVEDSEAA